jgi:hypothetical protein
LNTKKNETTFLRLNLIIRDASPPDLQLLVTLNVTLDSTDRVELVNDLFENNVTYNGSYLLTTVQLIVNTTTQIIGMI